MRLDITLYWPMAERAIFRERAIIILDLFHRSIISRCLIVSSDHEAFFIIITLLILKCSDKIYENDMILKLTRHSNLLHCQYEHESRLNHDFPSAMLNEF